MRPLRIMLVMLAAAGVLAAQSASAHVTTVRGSGYVETFSGDQYTVRIGPGAPADIPPGVVDVEGTEAGTIQITALSVADGYNVSMVVKHLVVDQTDYGTSLVAIGPGTDGSCHGVRIFDTGPEGYVDYLGVARADLDTVDDLDGPCVPNWTTNVDFGWEGYEIESIG